MDDALDFFVSSEVLGHDSLLQLLGHMFVFLQLLGLVVRLRLVVHMGLGGLRSLWLSHWLLLICFLYEW